MDRRQGLIPPLDRSVFDSGYERGAPAQFSLDGVAPGFQMPMPLSGITLFGNAIHSGEVRNPPSRWRKRVRAQLVLSGIDGRRTPKTRKTHVLVDGVVRTHPLTDLRADFVAIPKRCRTEDGRYAMTVEVVDKALLVGVGRRCESQCSG